MTKDLTVEQCLRNFETFQGLVDRAHSEQDRRERRGFLYLNKIAFALLTDKVHSLPTAEPEEIVGTDAMPFDGTWYRCDEVGGLQAFDDLDCVWYDIEIIDDDPDVVVYFMDIRAELMRQ